MLVAKLDELIIKWMLWKSTKKKGLLSLSNFCNSVRWRAFNPYNPPDTESANDATMECASTQQFHLLLACSLTGVYSNTDENSTSNFIARSRKFVIRGNFLETNIPYFRCIFAGVCFLSTLYIYYVYTNCIRDNYELGFTELWNWLERRCIWLLIWQIALSCRM